jgi:hypothetical protein
MLERKEESDSGWLLGQLVGKTLSAFFPLQKAAF